MTPGTKDAPEIQCIAGQMAASLLQSEFIFYFDSQHECKCSATYTNLTQKVELGD